jgi:hypothetical protein
VREHTAKVNPPRALWVPFELGRPLGAPDDPAFQRKVLEALLALFARESGPVLEEFAEDAPGSAPGDMSGWVCPVNLAPPAETSEGRRAEVAREIESLMPWYALAVERRGRNAMGLSGLAIEEAARFIAEFVADQAVANPCPDIALPQALKFAADDLKAWYLEAATAQPGSGDGGALRDWFWAETAAGKLLLELREVCRGLDNPGMQLLGEKALVPRSHEHLTP